MKAKDFVRNARFGYTAFGVREPYIVLRVSRDGTVVSRHAEHENQRSVFCPEKFAACDQTVAELIESARFCPITKD